MLKEKRDLKKQAKLEKKNKIWKENYGVSYNEVKDKISKKKQKGFPKFKKLLSFYKESKSGMILLILLGILGGVICLIYPLAMQNIIDNLTIGNFGIIFWLALIYLGADVLTRTIFWAFYVISNKITGSVSHNIRVKLADAVCGTKTSKFDTSASGSIINRISNDPSNFTSCVIGIIDYGIDLLMNLMYLIYAIYVNVWLGLIMMAIGLYTFVVNYIFIQKFYRPLRKRGNILNDKNTSEYSELSRGIKDVRYLNIKNNFLGRITQTSLFRFKSNYNLSKIQQVFSSVRNYGMAILVLGFIVFGTFLVQSGLVSLGAFLVILIYRYNVFNIFNNASNVLEQLQQGEIAAERMCEILENEDYPKEVFGDKKVKKVTGKIEFKDVTYSYKENEPLFKDINFIVEPNECVGIVGKSGQGKSTIISLITKLYDLQGGKIMLDGNDITKLSENSLRNNISTVPQMPYIFNLSIKENLLLAKPDATQEELEEVCKKAFIHDFIVAKPDKYDTIVGEGGITLSGGQKQRLAIARVLLKNSKVILLDEATSALDNESQEKIKKTIKAMKKAKTIIIVAHRLTTVRDCDKIFVMEGNKIVASGSHKMLMKNCEEYKNLYQNEEI